VALIHPDGAWFKPKLNHHDFYGLTHQNPYSCRILLVSYGRISLNNPGSDISFMVLDLTFDRFGLKNAINNVNVELGGGTTPYTER
jgi:hypothetical protein